MYDRLMKLLNNSYCPITKFRVSAVAVMKDGTLFDGVNVEDASTRAGVCAERSAIFSAIAAGYKKGDFKEIHVLCGDSNKISSPCFVCRQILIEFLDLDAKVIAYNNNGDMHSYSINDLCPYPFNEEDLK